MPGTTNLDRSVLPIPHRPYDGPVFEDRRIVWEKRLAEPPANQFVVLAEEEGDGVGFACAYGRDDPRWGTLLDNIHVRPALHRRHRRRAHLVRLGIVAQGDAQLGQHLAYKARKAGVPFLEVDAAHTARPGQADALRALLRGMVPHCRAEPGNLRWDVWQDQAQADRYVLDELYRDDDAVAAHRETPHFRYYLAGIHDVAERIALVLDPVEVDAEDKATR